jgi:serine/threonine-protein kinase
LRAILGVPLETLPLGSSEEEDPVVKQPAADVVVAGKYLLEGQLASGGMGSVWVARHMDLDIPVAIKFMGPEVASSEEGRLRFEREAKAAAYLQSPHVVNVMDYGVDEGLAYIAMELLVGEDLEDRLFRVKRLSLSDTLTILRQAAKALRRAQELGIVHRDIKPQNLYIARGDEGEETLKILDFGIAKETGPTLLAQGTNTGQIIGSPHYMSPEAVRGARDLDFRSDLWSLAVIAFQCVTGRLPFPGEIVGDVMGMILADPIPKPTSVAPDLPPEIDDFFEKALARDRTKRFQSAREMADAFAEVVGGAPLSRDAVSSRPPAIFDEPTPSAPGPNSGGGAVISKKVVTLAAPSSPGAVAASAKGEPARPRKGVFAAAIAVVAVGAVVLFVVRGGGSAGNGQSGPASAAPDNSSVGHVAATSVPAPPSSAPPAASAAASAVPDPAPGSSASASPGAQASASASGKAAQANSPKSGRGAAAPKSTGPKRSWGF